MMNQQHRQEAQRIHFNLEVPYPNVEELPEEHESGE